MYGKRVSLAAVLAVFAFSSASHADNVGSQYFNNLINNGNHLYLDFSAKCQNPKLDADTRITNCIQLMQDGRNAGYDPRGYLITLYTSKHDFRHALEYANQLFDNLPSNASVGHPGAPFQIAPLQIRSEVYAEMGRYQEAMADVAVIFEIAPDEPSSYNERCWVRAVANQELDVAMADCNKSLELRPNNASVLDSRGLANYKVGRLNEALADYSAAVSDDKNLMDALYMRGVIERKLGDTAKGDADIAEATEKFPILPGLIAAYGVNP